MVKFLRTVRIAGCWSNIGPTLAVIPRFVERIRSWPGVLECTASMSMSGPTAVIYFMTSCADMGALESALAHSAADAEYLARHQQHDALFDWTSMHDVLLTEVA